MLLQGNRLPHILHCHCRLLLSQAGIPPCVSCSGCKKSHPGSLHSSRVILESLNRQAQPPDRISQDPMMPPQITIFMKTWFFNFPQNSFLFLKSSHLSTNNFLISNTRVLRSPITQRTEHMHRKSVDKPKLILTPKVPCTQGICSTWSVTCPGGLPGLCWPDSPYIRCFATATSQQEVSCPQHPSIDSLSILQL